MKDYVLYSGAARGADTAFQEILDSLGLKGKAFHIRPEGNTNLTPYLKKNGYQPIVADSEKLQEASKALRELGVGYFNPNTLAGALQCRNYYQVIKSDMVIAVAEVLPDFSGVKGGTNTAVQLAIRLGKPVFILDTKTEEWFRLYDEGHFNTYYPNRPPEIPRRFTGVGTRGLENYNICKDGVWVPSPGYLGDEKVKRLRSKLRIALYKSFG